MFHCTVGIVLGAAIGALLAGVTGAVLGAVLGLALGLFLASLRKTRAGVPPDVRAVKETRQVMCISRGEVADCVVWRDEETGRVLDVERCSLEPPDIRPRCAKRCLDMMRSERTEAAVS